MRRTLLVAVVVLVLLVAAILWWRRPTSPPSSASSSAAQTAGGTAAAFAVPADIKSQAALEADIRQNGVTPGKATLLFSLAIAPLPGVTIPAGFVRDPTDFDGTPAVEALYQVWAFLTPEQRRVAAELIQGNATRSARHASIPQSDAVHALFLKRDDNTPYFDYDDLIALADNAVGGFLNRPTIPYISDVQYRRRHNGTAYAETFSWWHYEDANEPDPEKRAKTAGPWHEFDQHACHIAIFNSRFVGIDKVNALAVFAHELTHCYQQRAVDDPGKVISAPQWVKEGEATWAMVAAVPLGTKVVEDYWTTYSQSPKMPYMDRSYNALGVFAHLSDCR